MSGKLTKLEKSRSLVSIRRDNIDGLRVQGFVLAYSNQLILIQYVYDFNLDGLMVLRRSDITDIETDKIDKFQTTLLKREGSLSQVAFKNNFNVTDWPTVFNSIGKDHEIVIVENENAKEPIFLIGKIHKISQKSVSILGFSGAAIWHKKPTVMNYENISSFQAGNNYSEVYKRYFKKRPRINRSSRGQRLTRMTSIVSYFKDAGCQTP